MSDGTEARRRFPIVRLPSARPVFFRFAVEREPPPKRVRPVRPRRRAALAADRAIARHDYERARQRAAMRAYLRELEHEARETRKEERRQAREEQRAAWRAYRAGLDADDWMEAGESSFAADTFPTPQPRRSRRVHELEP